ncbi:TetR/AcrR family transcriptional regulator [Granulicoccus phenolivorans]|uniref:TetR/AcrR family transcriptional regulator n=1 Tax=Granulicoccus phenolivorans TaxID=266854 RepID=UPI0004280C3D|nr:TetR/AcrR family transcriptional regulator [Granulicoccus phenolivorans]
MAGRGRPRKSESPTGRGTRADILYAAAALFAVHGFQASTHAIAEKAGISQATLYHYFPNREEILLTLLLDTVQPTIDLAGDLLVGSEPAAARLWALTWWDARQLGQGEVNLGALYLLPEVQDEAFARFRDAWQQVERRYSALAEQCRPGAGAEASLVIGLVESVILARHRGTDAALPAEQVADAAVLLVARAPIREADRRSGQALAAALPGPEPLHALP